MKFELSRGAVAGMGVVLFCLFLWMFIFGVWTGQTLLSPYPEITKGRGVKAGSVPFIRAVEKKRIVGKRGTVSPLK